MNGVHPTSRSAKNSSRARLYGLVLFVCISLVLCILVHGCLVLAVEWLAFDVFLVNTCLFTD
jgi:hypothetical protein